MHGRHKFECAGRFSGKRIALRHMSRKYQKQHRKLKIDTSVHACKGLNDVISRECFEEIKKTKIHFKAKLYFFRALLEVGCFIIKLFACIVLIQVILNKDKYKCFLLNFLCAISGAWSYSGHFWSFKFSYFIWHLNRFILGLTLMKA